jgi:hypothetical protein
MENVDMSYVGEERYIGKKKSLLLWAVLELLSIFTVVTPPS